VAVATTKRICREDEERRKEIRELAFKEILAEVLSGRAAVPSK